jgi:integrase
VEAVTVGDVRRLHRSLKTTPSSPIAYSPCWARLSFAEHESLRAKHTNPAHDVTPFPELSRERFLTPDEMRRLGDELRRAETGGLQPAPKQREHKRTAATQKHYVEPTVIPANPFAVAALRFLLLTGCRESEALTLR